MGGELCVVSAWAGRLSTMSLALGSSACGPGVGLSDYFDYAINRDYL